jgi:hypothetical protein
MKDLDLDRLVESGDIVEYVYEDETLCLTLNTK